MKLEVSERGFFGEFGGAYVPEMLYPNVRELQQRYRELIEKPGFQRDLTELLRDYAGRPTPLFKARKLSARYNTEIFLKREDLLHTGSHKINNTLGHGLSLRQGRDSMESRRLRCVPSWVFDVLCTWERLTWRAKL